MSIPQIQPKHIGASNELKAAIWLLNLGYDVFRNVSAFGPIDLIAIKYGEEPLFLDVKGAGQPIHRDPKENEGYKKEYLPKRFPDVKPYPNGEQIRLNVKFLYVGDNNEFRIMDNKPRGVLVEEEVPLEDRVGWKF